MGRVQRGTRGGNEETELGETLLLVESGDCFQKRTRMSRPSRWFLPVSLWPGLRFQ